MTLRYHGHLALVDFDQRDQERLSNARVLLIGLGGVGCPVAQYLAAAGVGHLGICDFDRVSETNLSRQILFRERDVGSLKTQVAEQVIKDLNPHIQVSVHNQRLDAATAADAGAGYHLWIDSSDNWATRMAVNEAALLLSIPWIMAAAVRREGQLLMLQPGQQPAGPCYACLYGEAANTMDNCAGAGVLSTVAGSVGLAAAQQAIRFLVGRPMVDELLLYDGDRLNWQALGTAVNPDCRVCQR